MAKYVFYVCASLTAAVFILQIWALTRSKKYLQSWRFDLTWGGLFSGIRRNRKTGIAYRLPLTYYLMMMLRRIAFVATVYAFEEHLSAQVILILYSNIIVLIYTGRIKPLEGGRIPN